jgi:hypothetical protein
MQATLHKETIMNHLQQTRFWRMTWFVVLLFSGQVLAQTIERPTMQVGDRWKYDTRDGWTNLPISQTDRVITAVSAHQIEASENSNPAIYTSEMNPVETPENRFEPPAKALQFPFNIGSEWSYEGKTTLKAQGVTGRSQYTVKVVNQEKIAVPGGTFDTYKLIMQGYFTTNSSAIFTRTYWYAPSIRAFVKIEHISPRARWTSELTDASVKP